MPFTWPECVVEIVVRHLLGLNAEQHESASRQADPQCKTATGCWNRGCAENLPRRPQPAYLNEEISCTRQLLRRGAPALRICGLSSIAGTCYLVGLHQAAFSTTFYGSLSEQRGSAGCPLLEQSALACRLAAMGIVPRNRPVAIALSHCELSVDGKLQGVRLRRIGTDGAGGGGTGMNAYTILMR